MDVVSIVIASISLIVSTTTAVWTFIDRSNRRLKYRILNYVYKFFSHTYMIENLPTTKNIVDEINKGKNKVDENKINYYLIELSHEEKIFMVSDLGRDFNNSCWQPNVNYNKAKKIEITKLPRK